VFRRTSPTSGKRLFRLPLPDPPLSPWSGQICFELWLLDSQPSSDCLDDRTQFILIAFDLVEYPQDRADPPGLLAGKLFPQFFSWFFLLVAVATFASQSRISVEHVVRTR
jgi:hypothetical protein